MLNRSALPKKGPSAQPRPFLCLPFRLIRAGPPTPHSGAGHTPALSDKRRSLPSKGAYGLSLPSGSMPPSRPYPGAPSLSAASGPVRSALCRSDRRTEPYRPRSDFPCCSRKRSAHLRRQISCPDGGLYGLTAESVLPNALLPAGPYLPESIPHGKPLRNRIPTDPASPCLRRRTEGFSFCRFPHIFPHARIFLILKDQKRECSYEMR